MLSCALSMKSCSTLSRKRRQSSTNSGCSFHSWKYSRFSDDRQQTAVRCWPCWSMPVGRVISLHRFEVLTLRSEEHTSELQSLMRISYAVFCLKTKKNHKNK